MCTQGDVVQTEVLTRLTEVSLPPDPCTHDGDDDYDKINFLNDVRTETNMKTEKHQINENLRKR